jgi:hypothetical protein
MKSGQGLKGIWTGHLLTWSERLSSLAKRSQWLDALSLALDFYQVHTTVSYHNIKYCIHYHTPLCPYQIVSFVVSLSRTITESSVTYIV